MCRLRVRRVWNTIKNYFWLRKNESPSVATEWLVFQYSWIPLNQHDSLPKTWVDLDSLGAVKVKWRSFSRRFPNDPA